LNSKFIGFPVYIEFLERECQGASLNLEIVYDFITFGKYIDKKIDLQNVKYIKHVKNGKY